MAIAQMAKVIIVSHRSFVSELLESLQEAGICQILNAEEALVGKALGQGGQGGARPKDLEEVLTRLDRSISFVRRYASAPKGLAAALAPRVVVDEQLYEQVVSDGAALSVVDRCEQVEAAMERTRGEIESLLAALEGLVPWQRLETPVEELGRLRCTACWVGLIPVTQFEQAVEKIAELGGAVQTVGSTSNKNACLVVGLRESADEVQKVLRSAEFEAMSFEGMTGTVRELVAERRKKLEQAQVRLAELEAEAAALAEGLLKLEILYDHYWNLLDREQTEDGAPATEYTVLLEGWVKKKDYPRLEEIVSGFEAASVSMVEPAEDEEVPVEIENKRVIKPFEVITRLYGMPRHFEVDPTVFLAPFFALFFALCLTDAGYGLVIVALVLLVIKKMQGDKKLMRMLGICGAVTVVAGALTGGWFGNAHDYLPGWFGRLRERLMWFDPFEDPMIFFRLALVLGYIQIMAGLAIAFGHNLKRRNYVAAICDQLTWIVMLNSIVLLLAARFGALPAWTAKVCTVGALVPAAVILLFSQREGAWVGRLGMGLYNVFSTIFFMGDVLSYLRLMALGMVTAGLAMAINVIAEIAGEIPYGIGIVAAMLVLVAGHGFNMAINALGAFVHTLRLQYVEFFPKFLVGGGRAFEPLSKRYKHVYIKKEL